MGKQSKLIKDLNSVPSIVGELGLSIAAAQKAFNHDYLNNIQRILGMAKMMMGSDVDADGKALTADAQDRTEKFKALFLDLLKACAPPRYQYTETTLAVRLDLAQTMDLSATAGVGAGFGAIAVNAAFTMGYGYDYRAAAECRTVINAIFPDETVFTALLSNAKQFRETALELPAGAEVDDEIKNLLRDTYEKMIGVKPPDTTEKPPAPKT